MASHIAYVCVCVCVCVGPFTFTFTPCQAALKMSKVAKMLPALVVKGKQGKGERKCGDKWTSVDIEVPQRSPASACGSKGRINNVAKANCVALLAARPQTSKLMLRAPKAYKAVIIFTARFKSPLSEQHRNKWRLLVTWVGLFFTGCHCGPSLNFD